jgi:hypothetical protein
VAAVAVFMVAVVAVFMAAGEASTAAEAEADSAVGQVRGLQLVTAHLAHRHPRKCAQGMGSLRGPGTIIRDRGVLIRAGISDMGVLSRRVRR